MRNRLLGFAANRLLVVLKMLVQLNVALLKDQVDQDEALRQKLAKGKANKVLISIGHQCCHHEQLTDVYVTFRQQK